MQHASCERDAGNAALELLILAPIVLLLISLVVAAGRTSVAQGAVQAAARDAARQASIARSAAAAQSAGTLSAGLELASEGLGCVSAPVVQVDTGGFSTPVGQSATVTATVQCTVPLSDLLLPGVPGTRTLSARFTSPLDPFRGR